jgi:hypothetical protein
MPDKPESELTAVELQDKYDSVTGGWGEHPDHTMKAWREEVANEDTRLGYWNWVGVQLMLADDNEDETEDED